MYVKRGYFNWQLERSYGKSVNEPDIKGNCLGAVPGAGWVTVAYNVKVNLDAGGWNGPPEGRLQILTCGSARTQPCRADGRAGNRKLTFYNHAGKNNGFAADPAGMP